ncbi:MAG: sigma-70 family RNA polymerase sigma factor [Rubrivivax sp.]|nr:sigma-70 family RNA polymerase sigma factor [Pyrinomonadaceae bacterium]
MLTIQESEQRETADPSLWLDRHGDSLYRYALFRLRDPALAEDAVQETLLAALQGHEKFAGRGSERTWLIGILKHKIVDHFRRTSREAATGQIEDELPEQHGLFNESGKWADHWSKHNAPVDWRADPARLCEQGEFWEVFSQCLSPLPERVASAFLLREVDGVSSAEICEVFGISANNLWVMLHRARTQLRRCIEVNWFRREADKS